MAVVYANLGKNEEALELHRKSLDIRLRVSIY